MDTRAARLCDARPRHAAGPRPRAVVRHAARLRAAHDRAVESLPVPCGRGDRTARHAHRTGPAAVHRECLQPAGHVDRQGLGHVAVHPVDRQALRSGAERLPRRPARRAGLHARRARLPAEAARHVRRLASRAGRLQLGRRQRGPRDRPQPETRPADRLPQPEDAGRDALLRAQAAGREEPHRAARGLRIDAARDREPPLLPERADPARHRRSPGGPSGRPAARRIPRAEPLAQQAGDPGRRHAAGAAALRQRQRVRARAARLPGPAGQLDRLGRADDDEAGRCRQAGRHERSRTARGQSHPAAHAGARRLDADGAPAPAPAPRRRVRARGRQRDDAARP
ncbi:hypothetical protein X551_04707 [Methylibium sp. T29]|nr:hypothetical protein X551_04707 [Methylibium sp. T29]